jgi:hypothetical protein
MGMLVAGCQTPEEKFMGGGTSVARVKPAAHVAKVAPAKVATPILVVPQQNSTPVMTNPVEIITNNPPADMVNRVPPVVVANPPPADTVTNMSPLAPVVVPDDATPAPTKPAEIPAAPVALPTIVTPDASIAGKVVAYNSAARFAVMSFPAGPMPGQDQSVFVYRGGLKVGEIKITGPQRDNNTVGDVVNGDAQMGDDVRNQ